jgi:hypothetical protein
MYLMYILRTKYFPGLFLFKVFKLIFGIFVTIVIDLERQILINNK